MRKKLSSPTKAAASSAADIQRITRSAHAQEKAQDYVETVAGLIKTRGEARVTDIAKALGVTHVTVIRTLKRLQRDGWITTEPYRSVFLTEKGQRMAEKSKARHETVVAFLESVGVSPETARIDAEGIEHHVSPETLAVFKAFLKR